MNWSSNILGRVFRLLPESSRVLVVVGIAVVIFAGTAQIVRLFTQASHGGCNVTINKNNLESTTLKYFDDSGGSHYQLDYRYQGCDVTVDGVELLVNGWDERSPGDSQPLWHKFNNLQLINGAKLTTRSLLSEKDTIYDYMSVNWTGYLDTRKGANRKDICGYLSGEEAERKLSIKIYTKDKSQLVYTNNNRISWGEFCTGRVVAQDIYYIDIHAAVQDPVYSQEGQIFVGLHQATNRGNKALGDTILPPPKSNNMLWQALKEDGEPDTSKRGLKGSYYITDYALAAPRPPLIKTQVDLFSEAIAGDIDSFGYEFNQSNWPVLIKGGLKLEVTREGKLDDTSVIDVSGTGFVGGNGAEFYPQGNGRGPGGGIAGGGHSCEYFGGGDTWFGGGGSYGGKGRPLQGNGNLGNPPSRTSNSYGDALMPKDFGSGGAGYHDDDRNIFGRCKHEIGAGGAGAGRLWVVADSIIIFQQSRVLANGAAGGGDGEPGGGSGGSILIEANNFTNDRARIPDVRPGDTVLNEKGKGGSVSNGTLVWQQGSGDPPDELKFGRNLQASGGLGGGGGGRIAVLVKPSAPIEPTIDEIKKTTQAGQTPPNTKVDFIIGYVASRNGGLEGEYICSNLNKTYKSWFFVTDSAKPGLRFETADPKPVETDCDGKLIWDDDALELGDDENNPSGEIKITFTLTEEACRQPGKQVENSASAQVYLTSGVVYSRPAAAWVEAKCLLTVAGNVSSAAGDIDVPNLKVESPSVVTAKGAININSSSKATAITPYAIDTSALKSTQTAIITRLVKEFAKHCGASFTGGICKSDKLPDLANITSSATVILTGTAAIEDFNLGQPLGIIVEGSYNVTVKGKTISGLAVYAPQSTLDFDGANPRDLNINGIFIADKITGLNNHFGEISFDSRLIKTPPPGLGQLLKLIIQEKIP